MDNKLDYANILSINDDEDEQETIDKESKKDLIDSLIKDIDLKKNYSLRYNFYTNFIKMYEKNPRIIKQIYKELSSIKSFNEKEKVLFDKYNYTTTKVTGGQGKISRSDSDILNEKIIEIIDKIKISEMKNKKNNKILYNNLEKLIIKAYGYDVDKETVNKIINKIMYLIHEGEQQPNNPKSIRQLVRDALRQQGGEEIQQNNPSKIEKLISDIVDNLEKKSKIENKIRNNLATNIDFLISDLLKKNIITPKKDKTDKPDKPEIIDEITQPLPRPPSPLLLPRPPLPRQPLPTPSAPLLSDLEQPSPDNKDPISQYDIDPSSLRKPKVSQTSKKYSDDSYENLINEEAAKVKYSDRNNQYIEDTTNYPVGRDMQAEPMDPYDPTYRVKESNQGNRGKQGKQAKQAKQANQDYYRAVQTNESKTDYQDKEIYKNVVKALKKHYDLKNLVNINNKYNPDEDNTDFNDTILNFNKQIDLYNERDDSANNKNKKAELKDIKTKLLAFENNPKNYYNNIQLSFEDRFVFIITTFLIRYISLILVQWSVDINLIKSFEEGFLYYAVIYIAIFWFVVLFVNIDNSFKVDYMNLNNSMNSFRLLFYYFYMGTNGITRLIVHSCIIFILIIIPIVLNIKKYNNYAEEDEDKFENIISYEERKKLTKSLSLFTIYLWVLTSIIATKF